MNFNIDLKNIDSKNIFEDIQTKLKREKNLDQNRNIFGAVKFFIIYYGILNPLTKKAQIDDMNLRKTQKFIATIQTQK